MSDDAVSQPEDKVARAELSSLQEQLKATRVERDRQIFEKSEIVSKANAYAKERDEARARLSAVTAERDRLAAETAAVAAKADEAQRAADASTRRADDASAEIARLRHVIDTAPSSDPAIVLWTLISERTKSAVAWVRAKIPADSPILPWFDRAIATIVKIGCVALKLVDAFVRWATPRVIELFNWGKREIEARMAKK